MLNTFINYNYLNQTIICSLIAFLSTTLGSLVVYFFKKVNKTILDIFLSLSTGIMLSSTIFSLIIPAAEITEKNTFIYFLTLIGFILGALFIIITEKLFNNKINNKNKSLIISMTLHNIPESMSVGIAFASAHFQNDNSLLASAILLSIGIIIQNFPEGAAISLPLKRNGYSNNKAFLWGMISGIVEPISAVVGTIIAFKFKFILPISLTLASGAMLFIIIKELIPESQNNKYKNLTAFISLFGFIIMMLLDNLF